MSRRLLQQLERAYARSEFELYYQPQVNIATSCVESLEALLRWNHVERGLLAPAAFMPALESCELIDRVGGWAVEQIARDCRQWHARGLPPVRVAVNVSPVQLRRQGCTARLLDQLAHEPLCQPGYGLDVEITETALIDNLDAAGDLLSRWRAAGIRVALDDFGTGFSSLSLLSKLPVDLLKIDRSFVAGLPDIDTSVTLCRSVISLASALGMSAVAEGVENLRQLRLLKLLNCDYYQGYHFCPPLPAAQIESLLSREAGLPCCEPAHAGLCLAHAAYRR